MVRLRLREPLLAAAAAVIVACAGCGGRSVLVAGGPAADHTGGPAGEGGSGGHGGASTATGGSPPVPCVLSPAGEPMTLVTFPEGDADTPDLAVIDPGAPGKPARFVHQAISQDANFWHPELRLVDYTLGAAWPADVVAGHAPKLAGADAHAGGRIVAAPGAQASVGLLWYHGDFASPDVTPGVKFRTFDVAGWKGGDEHFVDEKGEVIYGLAAGQSIGPSEEGYVGDGYGAVWRAWVDEQHVAARVGVIASDGSTALTPIQVTPPNDYPGRSADIAWTGARYVLAVSHDATTCAPGADPPCTPDAVTTLELSPPGAVQASLMPRAMVPVATPGQAPFRPRLARSGDAVFVAWSEGAPEGDGPRVVRVAPLDAGGALAGAPFALAETTELLTPVAIHGSDLGFVVAWIERGDPAVMPEQAGFGRLIAFHLAHDGKADPAPVTIDVTAATGTIALAAVAEPRAALVSWAGDRAGSPRVTYLARLDCHAEPP